MPIYMEISRLDRTVMIVARGAIAPEEVYAMVRQLADAKVRSFAKILEIAEARSEWSVEQLARIAGLLRQGSNDKRGPVAFVVDSTRGEFAAAFAEVTVGEGPVRLFKGLRDARQWIGRIQRAEHVSEELEAMGSMNAVTEGIFIRGNRQRRIPVRSLDAA